MKSLLAAILKNDVARVRTAIARNPGLATALIDTEKLYESSVFHWIYVGDTALHLAAAGYRIDIAQTLLDAGADPNSAKNRRRSSPLHYAADGFITGSAWDPVNQVKTLEILLKAGAEIDAQDQNGATALHRAVRTRCSSAALHLLAAGCDFTQRNKSGSTAFHLAVQNTGRGGSGEEIARHAQRQIIEGFLSFGVSVKMTDGASRTVLECAQHNWTREILPQDAA
jgi:hypothetical protein